MSRHIRLLAIASLACLSSRVAASDRVSGDQPQRYAMAAQQWKERLRLTDEQARKFIAAEAARETDLIFLQDQLSSGMLKLRAQLTNSAPENEVQIALFRMTRIRKALADRDAQFDAAVSAFLTPSQRAKLLVWRSLLSARGKPAPGVEPGYLRETASVEESEPE
jgi:Spy/CpxP family protein refolding chaperone